MNCTSLDKSRLIANVLALVPVIILIGLLSSLLGSCSGPDGLVHDVNAFHQAVENAEPGDEIVLANGIWRDAELLFEAQGTEENPIRLTVQDKGQVILEGQSNLRIAGEYLHVEGLVFRNGYTPTSEVISFRKNKTALANFCRVTECVIDNYNNPERFESDRWVGIYGRHNRFDHNYLTGKRNHSVTVAVRLDTEESRANFHRIDHNYFGHRPILGANGGETLRIGTSHYSLTNSNTLVEYNYFDRCNGEHEIISNKSCQNTFRGNTFYECQGTLTMRHGNETLVESNYFFGNQKANTGGVRIINETQTVINNYCEGLTGYRFRGALVIMNGVPNSPPNRYFQVTNSEASNNTFINCDHIQLCAGSDTERSAVPINSKVTRNIFHHNTRDELFTVYDDISGINFDDNLLSSGMSPIVPEGFVNKELTFDRDSSGIYSNAEVSAMGYGIQERVPRATPENTGVKWYPINEEELNFGNGKVVTVKAGENTLWDAVQKAEKGDIIELSDAGEYAMTKSIEVSQPLIIRGANGLKSRPEVTFQKNSLFNIENGGGLKLQRLLIDGKDAPDNSGNALLRTSRYSMIRNYKLFVEDCVIRNLDVNHSFNVLRVFKNTFADSIVLRNSVFQNISGHVLSLNKETDDIGIYNAENVVIENCAFQDIEGTALQLHRGGRDESTFGPILKIDHCTFNEVGKGSRNKAQASVALHGVQLAHLSNSIFNDCQPITLHLVVGEPITTIRNCNFSSTGEITSNDDAYEVSGSSYFDPGFDADGIRLNSTSTLIGKAADGRNLGFLGEHSQGR